MVYLASLLLIISSLSFAQLKSVKEKFPELFRMKQDYKDFYQDEQREKIGEVVLKNFLEIGSEEYQYVELWTQRSG